MQFHEVALRENRFIMALCDITFDSQTKSDEKVQIQPSTISDQETQIT